MVLVSVFSIYIYNFHYSNEIVWWFTSDIVHTVSVLAYIIASGLVFGLIVLRSLMLIITNILHDHLHLHLL